MVMISRVEIVDCLTRAVTENGVDFDVMAQELGIPRIVGNFLFNNGKVNMVSPNGETLIIASPMQIEGDKQVLVHFAIGTENRRICHNLPIGDFEKVVMNLNTILALAKLEEGRE
jgi:hypothetical protein